MLPSRTRILQARRLLRNDLKRSLGEGEAEAITGLILEHAGYPASKYLSEPNLVLDEETTVQINEIVNEIHSGRPIQYILGYAWFCDLKLRVTPSVLIPRSETEELVHHIRSAAVVPPGKILDLGTGSGAIALALKSAFPEARVVGTDISEKALKVAAENATTLGMEIDWVMDDILHPSTVLDHQRFDLIVSNPPYVPESDRQLMESHVREHEPEHALFVPDNDPLLFYRAFAEFCRTHLEYSGVVWVEINAFMGIRTREQFRVMGYTDIQLFRDIHGRNRYISARFLPRQKKENGV